MSASQGKAGRPVVEGQGLFPVVDCVAILAVPSQAPEMRILFRVARGTCCRYAAIMPAIQMASGTGCLRMAAEQGVIGQLVIEARSRKAHQREAASMMLAVAGLASLRPRVRFSVKSPTIAHIGTDAGVAGKALSVLRLAGKGFVAGRAFGL